MTPFDVGQRIGHDPIMARLLLGLLYLVGIYTVGVLAINVDTIIGVKGHGSLEKLCQDDLTSSRLN